MGSSRLECELRMLGSRWARLMPLAGNFTYRWMMEGAAPPCPSTPCNLPGCASCRCIIGNFALVDLCSSMTSASAHESVSLYRAASHARYAASAKENSHKGFINTSQQCPRKQQMHSTRSHITMILGSAHNSPESKTRTCSRVSLTAP